MNEQEKMFMITMEQEIEKLPQQMREQVYRPCAENCVKYYVLPENKRMYDECNGDMDRIYSEYPDNEYVFRRVVEKGHIYEMGYPKCLCEMHHNGFAMCPGHCECSRQSIIYILHELNPDMKFTVETVKTVIGGADECLFRITVEK